MACLDGRETLKAFQGYIPSGQRDTTTRFDAGSGSSLSSGRTQQGHSPQVIRCGAFTLHLTVVQDSFLFFTKLTSLALKLSPTRPSQWPDWIIMCVTYLSGRGVPTEHLLDFLSIVAEEVDTADLLGSSK
jgi:hypothetical protein